MIELTDDPAPGVMIGDVSLEGEVAGAMTNAIYDGVSSKGLAMRITAGPRQQRPLDAVRAELGYVIDGVARLVEIVEASSPSAAWHVLVEERPEGTSLVDLAPVPEPTAIAWLVTLAGLAEAAHARGIVLYGIHPRLCFAHADGTWSGVAPRAMRFILGMPPARGGLCLEEVYLPFEVWRDRAGTGASDVFALCALGQFLVTGVHPFAAPTFDMAIAAVARMDRRPLMSRLGAVLDRGLVAAAEQRPTAADLRDALSAI